MRWEEMLESPITDGVRNMSADWGLCAIGERICELSCLTPDKARDAIFRGGHYDGLTERADDLGGKFFDMVYAGNIARAKEILGEIRKLRLDEILKEPPDN